MKKAIVTGIALILLGILIVIGGLFTMNYDLSRFQADSDDRILTVTESFSNIVVEAGEADVVFTLSPDSQCRVTTKDYQNIMTTALVEEGTLTIRREDTRKWYQRIGIFFGDQTITVYLPQDNWKDLTVAGNTGNVTIPEEFTFENVKVKVTTGHISVGSQVGRELNLAVTTGDITVRDTAPGNATLSASTGGITCEDLQILGNLRASASTGDVRLRNVVCGGQMTLETTTGDIKLTACDADSLDLQCSTGDIQGTLLTGKLFEAQTGTGKIRIPASIHGGSCKLKTSTGNIQISIS